MVKRIDGKRIVKRVVETTVKERIITPSEGNAEVKTAAEVRRPSKTYKRGIITGIKWTIKMRVAVGIEWVIV